MQSGDQQIGRERSATTIDLKTYKNCFTIFYFPHGTKKHHKYYIMHFLIFFAAYLDRNYIFREGGDQKFAKPLYFLFSHDN